nr:tyrosine-type recombinase/integrase [Acetobacter orientalis]
MKTPKSGPRGTDFGRNFSKFKTTIGLPAAITFHSFRHTVSTRLRNQTGDLRELWIDALLGHEASQQEPRGHDLSLRHCNGKSQANGRSC